MGNEPDESPLGDIENADNEMTMAAEEKYGLPGTENHVESGNPTSNNEEAEVPEYQQESEAANSPKDVDTLDASAADTTALQDDRENHSADAVQSLHIQEVKNVDDSTNGHIATQDGKSEIQETESALNLPVDNERQNEKSVADNTIKSPVEETAPDFSSFAPTQEEGPGIDWGQSVDAETSDLFGLSAGQDWSNGDFLAESNDIMDERPDPESQGYTLLNDQEDQSDDCQDPEMGNTSADVHDAEPDEVDNPNEP